MAGNIDDVFAAIIKDCQAVAAEAVKNAAKKAQKDVIKESYRYLAKYYANYHPIRYKRTKSLHKAIVPVIENHSTKDGISIEVGVEYDSAKLKGIYWSGSSWHQSGNIWKPVQSFETFSSDHGIPEPDWILNNFLEGEHGGYQQDNESTESLMEKFFDVKLKKRVQQYVNDELFNAITRRL